MTDPSKVQEDADMAYAEIALQRAARKALELGRRTQTPVWVVRDGALVDLAAEEQNENVPAQNG